MRTMVEYCVLGGVNDSEACAEELGELIGGRDIIVNLIPYNPTDVPMGHSPPTPEAVKAMVKVLTGRGVFTTVRHEMGQDIAGACGQLALKKGPSAAGDIEDLAGPTLTATMSAAAARAGDEDGVGGGGGGGAALRSRAKSRKPEGAVQLSGSEARKHRGGSCSARRRADHNADEGETDFNAADGASAVSAVCAEFEGTATTATATALATSKRRGLGGVEATLAVVAALSLMVLVVALAWKTLGAGEID